MAFRHEFLSGTSIDYDKSLFFDLMQTGDVYMGFAREEPMWGFNTLIKVLHSRTFPGDVLGQSNSGSLETTSATKFYDFNSDEELQESEIPDDGKQIYIARIDTNANSAAREDITNYIFLDKDNIGTLTIDYLNEDWMRIRGINIDFLETVLTMYTPTDFDYYIFNFTQSIDSRTIIQEVERINKPTIQYPVRLMYSSDQDATKPTSAFGNNLIGDLTRTVNIFGETVITGLNTEFVTEGAGYIEQNSITSAVFFLTTIDGIVIQDSMEYVDTISTDDEAGLIFSYPLVGEAVQNSGRLKITTTVNPTKLAIFSERFTDGAIVNDSQPPPLLLNYIGSSMLHTSIFDVLGLVKLDSTDVTFVRRIDNTDTERELLGDPSNPDTYPGVQGISAQDIKLITIEDNPDTTVKFATTSDPSIARRYFFDLVKVDKTLDSTTPTDKIYRQLFLCYKPSDSSGTNCTSTTYNHDELFDTTNWSYNLGSILFLCQKVPVFRSHLSTDSEVFTILV